MDPNTYKEDRLSDLPDDLLTGILSYLEMKEIVRSGILSKRWKSLWLSVPTLVLDQYDFKLRGKHRTDDDTKARFSNFVNEILVARKVPSLDTITFYFYKLDHHLVKLFVQSALERDISKLVLDHDSDFIYDDELLPCEMTHDWFSYNKLVVLKLIGHIAPNFPKTSSCFPSLKELELRDLYYRDCESLPNLLSCCPVLENMTILRGMEWFSRLGNTATLIVTSRSLKRLTLYCEVDYHFILDDDDFKLVIDAPALEYLNIIRLAKNECVVKNLSSLVEVQFGSVYLSLLFEILKGSPQLQILNLDFLLATDEYLSILPKLDVPSCLTRRLKTIDISFDRYEKIDQLRYLLMKSKVLERMTIGCYYLDESSKLELCNVILESAANSVTWSDIECGEQTVIISFSKPRI